MEEPTIQRAASISPLLRIIFPSPPLAIAFVAQTAMVHHTLLFLSTTCWDHGQDETQTYRQRHHNNTSNPARQPPTPPLQQATTTLTSVQHHHRKPPSCYDNARHTSGEPYTIDATSTAIRLPTTIQLPPIPPTCYDTNPTTLAQCSLQCIYQPQPNGARLISPRRPRAGYMLPARMRLPHHSHATQRQCPLISDRFPTGFRAGHRRMTGSDSEGP